MVVNMKGGFIIQFLRDDVMYLAIFGFFSFVWFGWAQERPRENWRKYLGLAAVLSLIACLLGVYLSVKNWHAGSALADFTAYKAYLVVFYTEFIIAAAGALLLMKGKKSAYVAPWILFIVGVHFFWLQHIFNDGSLTILAMLLIVISFISPGVARRLNVANSAITGIGAGVTLFCFGLLGLARYFMA